MREKIGLKNALFYFFIPVLTGFSGIYKVFFRGGCFAFDRHDEVAHTFAEVKLIWKVAAEGAAPFINLFNNFGTPVIGDPIINPFAPHAVSYLLFSAPLAATLNQFLIVSLTVSLLTYFYRRHFSLSLPVSSVCAVMLVLLPSFNHFAVHHQFQGTLLYFTAVLFMQQRLKTDPGPLSVSGLYLALIFFMLGVGLNGFVFGLPFLIMNQYLVSDRKVDRNFITFGALLFALLILSYPHFSSFLKWAMLSARYASDVTAHYTLKQFTMDLLFYQLPQYPHLNTRFFFPLTLLFTAAMGVIYLRAEKSRFLPAVIFMGVLPLCAILFLVYNWEIKNALPFIKLTDITKVLWFSNIFLLAAVGHALQRISEGIIPGAVRLLVWASALFSVFYILFVAYFYYAAGTAALFARFGNKDIFIFVSAGAFTGTAFLAYYVFHKKPFRETALAVISFSLALIFFHLLVMNQRVLEILPALTGRQLNCGETNPTHRYADISKAEFRPRLFLDMMEPYSRMTSTISPSPNGYLQLTAESKIFGTLGRSAILHGGFKTYLADNGVILSSPSYYSVFSENTGRLSRLGIGYLMTAEPLPKGNTGWALISESRDPSDIGRYLYKNRTKVGLGCLVSGNTDLIKLPANQVRYLDHNSIKYTPNTIHIDLPATDKDQDLVMLFVDWPGWKALVNGKPAALKPSVDHFLRVTVGPADRSVVFYFEPFTASRILYGIALSMLIFAAAAAFSLKAQRIVAKNE